MRNPLADQVVEIKPSGIRKFFDIVSEMKDAISLGVGEPDFATPWHIRDEGIYSLEKGHTKYTSNAGLMQLREEICNYLYRTQGIKYRSKTDVLITVGGSEAIDIGMRAMINPGVGEEILIPQPSYVSYEPCAILAGAKPVIINLKAENEFRLTAKELEDAITDKTKLLILPFPNNPTGAVYTEMSLCFGDSQCIAVCPWHIPRLQAGVGPYLHLAPGYLGYGQTFKCDFCEDIISDGKPPLCVAACPHGAQHFGPYAEMTALARRMAEERHGDLFGLQENGGTCLIYVSSIPFRDIEASLLRQGLISAGRPSLRPAGASLERENDLVGTVLAAPLAGAALAGLRLLRDHWRDKDED